MTCPGLVLGLRVAARHFKMRQPVHLIDPIPAMPSAPAEPVRDDNMGDAFQGVGGSSLAQTVITRFGWLVIIPRARR
jgi:hypothetical protein